MITITIGIPVFNEEENIERTVDTVCHAAALVQDLKIEIIIVDDGSTDGTPKKLEILNEKHLFVRVIHHAKNLGVGKSVKDIIQAATTEKLSFIPGDDFLSLFTLKNILQHAASADVIMYYYLNTEERHRHRIILSSFFTLIYMVAFNIHLKYINGVGVYPVKKLQELDIKAEGYNITGEMTVKLLRSGLSFYEVIGYLKPGSVSSSALKIKNIINVLSSFVYLFYDVRIKNRNQYKKKPRRVMDKIE